MKRKQIFSALIDIYSEAIKVLPKDYLEAITYLKTHNLHKGLCYTAEKLVEGGGAVVFDAVHNHFRTLGYICKTPTECQDQIEIKYTLHERLKLIIKLCTKYQDTLKLSEELKAN